MMYKHYKVYSYDSLCLAGTCIMYTFHLFSFNFSVFMCFSMSLISVLRIAILKFVSHNSSICDPNGSVSVAY